MRCSSAKIFPLLFVLGFCLTGVAVANAQATDLHDAASQLTKKLSDDPDVQKINGEHIVIAPFENINGKGDAVPRILQEMLTTSFIKAKHFKVLERDQLQSALDELHFQLSDLADPSKAKQIGKLAGAAYVLLGSISDTGSATSINARIVSIENGESVAADDIDIKAGDAPLAVGGINPALSSSTTVLSTDASATPRATAPAIDLNTNAVPATAGQFTGKKDNFGLLGGTAFKIAWREDLSKDPVYSFSAGDVIGDGTSRLVVYKTQSTTLDSPSGGDALADLIARRMSPQHSYQDVVSVLKWTDGKVKRTWVSEQLDGKGNDTSYLRVSPLPGKPAGICLSNDLSSSPQYVWKWDATTYKLLRSYGICVTDKVPTKNSVFVGIEYRIVDEVDYISLALWDYAINDAGEEQMTKMAQLSAGAAGITAGDFDADGNIEVATTQASDSVTEPSGKPIEIFDLQGNRKAVTSKSYGGRLTTWGPSGAKFPFIVARKNSVEDGKLSGGYIFFVQWNGESYDEVWKSNRIGDAVIDMQVCDPKSEGKPSLVVLSKDQKNYYLTKIVAAN